MDIPTRKLVQLPASTPSAYWDGYADDVTLEVNGQFGTRTWRADADPNVIIVQTKRVNRDAESDAQYIVDRCASGLYFGKVL